MDRQRAAGREGGSGPPPSDPGAPGSRALTSAAALRAAWAALGAIFLLAHGAAAEEANPAPAAPTPVPVRYLHTQPADAPRVSTAPETRGALPPGFSIDDLFEDPYPGRLREHDPAEFTAEEWAAIKKIHDGESGCNQDAYYVLLDKAADLDPAAAAPVAYDDLRKDPKRYRARPVSMTLQFFETVEAQTPRPARVKRVYNTTGFLAKAPKAHDMVVVVSRFPPPDMGPKMRFKVVGYFFKIQNFKTRKGSDTIDVPVIIAYRITPLVGGMGLTFDRNMAIMAVVLVLLIVVWIVIRTRLSRRSTAARSTYRPMRFEMSPGDVEQSKLSLPPDERPGAPRFGILPKRGPIGPGSAQGRAKPGTEAGPPADDDSPSSPRPGS